MGWVEGWVGERGGEGSSEPHTEPGSIELNRTNRRSVYSLVRGSVGLILITLFLMYYQIIY